MNRRRLSLGDKVETVYGCSTSNRFYPRVRGTLEQRFWAKVVPEPNCGCWLWAGDSNGRYGSLSYRSNGHQHRLLAHILSYRIHKGDVPDGLEVEHTCDMPACVNPDHLRAVTHVENMARVAPEKRGGWHVRRAR